jgi:hypothetical protein
MAKYHFSDELMTRFFMGDTTVEETSMILRAAEEDEDLKKEIDFMSSIPEEFTNNSMWKRHEEDGDETPANLSYLPMYRLAAQNKIYGKDMKASNDCVVRCEHYLLQKFNANISLVTLFEQSKANGWMRDGGTPLHHIGRLFELNRFSVVRRYDCNINIIGQEIGDGCQIIAVVNADKLYEKSETNDIPNHAVVVLAVTDTIVRIFDPQKDCVEDYLHETFNSAWEDSHYYIVSIIERGLRHYDPQPIDTIDFQLSDDLEELIEAIAENAHDVWARQRMDEGWTYGSQRDDEKKEHPDLVPYSDLTNKEKEYDRQMAKQTLMLVQRLGYKIVKE